jgi:IS30 family transposase
LKKQGYNQTFITNSMGRSNSTISRELSRNTGNRGYRHKQANNLACEQLKRTTYRFVLQNKAVGGFSADLNFLIQL